MAALNPKGTRSFGNRRRFWVKSIADLNAPTVEEITAETSLDITLLSYATSGRAAAETTRGQSPRRLGGTTTREHLGTVNRTFGDLVYTRAPQKPLTDPANKAYQTLQPFEEGYIVEVEGVPGEDTTWEPEAGVFVSVYPAELGVQVETETGDAEGDEFSITQPVGITGDPTQHVALVDAA